MDRRALHHFLRSSFVMHAGAIGGYVLLTVILTYPVAFHLDTHIPIAHQIPGWVAGDGDPWHVLWIFWFVNHSLLELGRLPLFTDLIFYPRGMDLMYLSLILLPLLLSLPLVSLVGLIITYNVLFLVSLAAAGYGMFLLMHDLTQDKRAAFVSGLVFAFSPYQMTHALEHLFLLLGAIWLPLYILFFRRFLSLGGRGNGVLASGFLLLTVLSNPYYAVYLVLFTGIYLIYQVWCPDGGLSRRLLIGRGALVIACTGFLTSPIAIPAFLAEWPDTRLYTPLSDLNFWSADLVAFFTPSPAHPLWGGLVAHVYDGLMGNLFEQVVYLGYAVLCLSAIAVFKVGKRETRFWCLAAGIFFVLSLGPFLHVYGRYAFTIDDMTLTLPLPFLLLYGVPVLGGARVASRFAIMMMLCVAVLVGFGMTYLLRRFDTKRWRSSGRMVVLGGVAMVILLEYLSVPFPMLDARMPAIYTEIGRPEQGKSSLLDLPLQSTIAKYHYYQTAHQRSLLVGFSPRPSRLLENYADTFPLIGLFKNPERVLELEKIWDRDEVRYVMNLFKLDVIVIHGDYLRDEIVERLKQFVLESFPVRRIVEDGPRSVIWLNNDDHEAPRTQRSLSAYHWDFSPRESPPFIAEGWSLPERWGEVSVTWSDAKESHLWFFLSPRNDLALELRVLPFAPPEGPPQGIKIYVNERFLADIELAAGHWQSFTVPLPSPYLTDGINAVRFVYRYTASPSRVLPDSQDPRMLAVAFDYIRFKQISAGREKE